MNTWTYIKADTFFNDLLPEIKNYSRKIVGTNTKGAPLDFSDNEKKAINEALKTIPDLNYGHYIKADRFFKDSLPDIKNYKYKIKGKNTRGNSLSFSESESAAINNGLRKLVIDLQFDIYWH